MQRHWHRLGRQTATQRFLELIEDVMKQDADGLQTFVDLREQAPPLERGARPPAQLRAQSAELPLQPARRAIAGQRVDLRLEEVDRILDTLEHASVDDRPGVGERG